MTSFCHFLLLFVSLAFYLKAIAAVGEVAKVHVVNALPENSEAMRISCSSKRIDLGEHDLNVGNDYSWSISEDGKKYLHRCEALWEKKFASWHAFQPRRDANHYSVIWLVKEAGFFLSWDNSTWVKKSTWETE